MKVIILIFVLSLISACSRVPLQKTHSQKSSSVQKSSIPSLPSSATGRAIRFYLDRVERDPEDFLSLNAVSGLYLKLVRETADHAYLSFAEDAAKRSLIALPAEGNPGGLASLAQSQAASHQFAAAKDTAKQLVKIAPHKRYSYEILGDAYLELGDYGQAAETYQQVLKMKDSTSIQTRLARLSWLQGKPLEAKLGFKRALAFAKSENSSDTVTSWCHWQLGDTSFFAGEYNEAKIHYKNSLKIIPDHIQTLASLGRLSAAQGNLVGAINYYERAVNIDPMPVFVMALGDLYQLSGRIDDANKMYSSVVDADRNQVDSRLDNRQLIMSYADHNIKLKEAYAGAVTEFTSRKDIYGADAVAWTAFKLGLFEEAKTAMAKAMRLGTKDARLFYHAGMIAKATGDNKISQEYLKMALKLSPMFDPLQAKIAKSQID